MANRILKFVQNMNKPVERFVVKQGWNLRIKLRRRQGGNYRVLSRDEKKEIRQYWRRYGKHVSPDWAAYNSYGNGIVDPRYIPESLFFSEIVPKLGDVNMRGLHHKNVSSQIFSSKQPKVIIRKNEGLYSDNEHRPIILREGLEACADHGEVIIKPSFGTYGGSGIDFWSREDGLDALEKIVEAHKTVVVQEIIKQHPYLSAIHSSSVNTLRVVTLLIDDRVEVLSTILRMGQKNKRVDNYSAGGIIACVGRDGTIRESTVQSNQVVLTEHPDGFVFKDERIPNFEKVLEDIYEQCWRIPYFRLVSWDYAIDEAGDPVLIEANFPSSQIDLHQINIGPIFGDYTDRVLDYVYKGKRL